MMTRNIPIRGKVSKNLGDDDDDDDVMVIGIDFGTTFSGAAWATLADFESGQTNLITTWPGTGGEEGKAPTELYYDDDDNLVWGFEVPPDADPARWFKLLLLKEDDLPSELRSSEFLLRARRMLREHNKTAVDLVADYLKELWNHILSTINRSRGEDVVDALRFHVVITVPAIWKGYARQSMEQAAKKAGIMARRAAGKTSLSFAPEPEAAALSTLTEPGRRPKKGDVYIICDAGGGTVDLISYEIDSTDPIAMHEIVEGSGGLCGGIFIDEAFELMCKNRLGKKWNHLSRIGVKEIMTREWERLIKPQFKPTKDDKKKYMVSIPSELGGSRELDDSSKEPVIVNGRIHFKGSHIEKAFTQVFDDIDKLVDGQIGAAELKKRTVTGIILVGGLGGSPYLYEHLQDRYRANGISILQSGGMRPRTAICNGAVFKGFLDGVMTESPFDTPGPAAPIRVTSTISRANYGIKVSEQWVEGKYLDEDKEWDEHECVNLAKNQMSWFLKRGVNVSAMSPVCETFYKTLDADTTSKSYSEGIWVCEEKVAPSRLTFAVRRLCSIIWRVDDLQSVMEFFTNTKGVRVGKLWYEVKMVPSGATLEFAVYVNGKRLGEQSVNTIYE